MPNYKDGSTLNLISSIARAIGTRTVYEPLKLLRSEEISRHRNVVLIVVDGLGYNYLTKYGKNSFLSSGLEGKITSVFPSTTAAAIPSFYTGTSCQEHCMTGWFTFIKELGMVVTSLPYNARVRCCHNLNDRKKMKETFNVKPFADKTRIKRYNIMPEDLSDSVFTRLGAGRAMRVPYKRINDGLKKMGRILRRERSKRKYIHMYYPQRLCYLNG